MCSTSSTQARYRFSSYHVCKLGPRFFGVPRAFELFRRFGQFVELGFEGALLLRAEALHEERARTRRMHQAQRKNTRLPWLPIAFWWCYLFVVCGDSF